MTDFYLVGMPNSGKSALFNKLTRSLSPVGNRAGVTVELREKAIALHGCPTRFFDLPGSRSFPAIAPDERLSLQALQKAKGAVFLCVIPLDDAIFALSLFASLAERFSEGNRWIFILSKSDLRQNRDGFLALEKDFSESTGVETIAVSQKDSKSVARLSQRLYETVKTPSPKTSEQIVAKREDKEESQGVTTVSRERSLAGALRRFSGKFAVLLSDQYPPKAIGRRHILEIAVSRPATGIPLFLFLLASVLFLSFGAPSIRLSSLLQDRVFSPLTQALTDLLPDGVLSRIAIGVFSSACSVLSSLPGVFFLFIAVAVGEDTGYIAKSADLFEPMMKKIGLRGSSFIPLLLGLGCTVPALLCTRNIPSERERCTVCSLLPMIPCSARALVYQTICRLRFPRSGWIICLCLYALSFALSFLAALGRSRGKKISRSASALRFIAPSRPAALSLPNPKNILLFSLSRTASFLCRVGGTVIAFSFLMRLLSSIPFFGGTLLSWVTAFPRVLLSPIGLGQDTTALALLSGIASKETIASVLSDDAALALLSTPSLLSLLCFSSLYCPCLPAFFGIRREVGGKSAWRSLLFCLASGYGVSFVVYNISQFIYI